MKNNIDEDIKKLEKAVKVLTGNDTGVTLDFEGTAQAIENVLEELETYKDKCIELATDIDALKTDLKELETYKKIAEKLAEECKMTKLSLDYFETDNDYFNGKVYMTTEEKLDWARKEVEKW